MEERTVLAQLSRAQAGAAISGYLLGLVVLAAFCIMRVKWREDNLTPRQWNWTRINLFLIFVSSFLFVLSGLTYLLLLMHSGSETLCRSTPYICLELYGATKALVYFFLNEKVHIVWNSLNGRPRCRSPVYLLCFATTVVYVPVCLLWYPLKGYIYGTRDQGRMCVFATENLASIPILIYDIFITVLLTALFLWPLLKRRLISAELRNLAHRTLITSIIALSASVVNIAIFFKNKGREPTWVCMGCCSLDVMIGAIAVFWSTRPTAPATERDIEFSSHPRALMPTFARSSKDTMETFRHYEGHHSVHGPVIRVSGVGEGEAHYVVPLKEGTLPKKTSTATFESVGESSVR